MKTPEDIESYLLDLGLPYEEVREGMWVVHDDNDRIENIVVSYAPPLVVFRVKVMDLPEEDCAPLLRKLLELNATEMVHGAYGIEGKAVVAVDTLESENLDLNEFKASVESLAMSIRDHYPALSALRTVRA